MAAPCILRLCRGQAKVFQYLSKGSQLEVTCRLLPKHLIWTTITRGTGFISRVTADAVWAGTTSVSNAGRKRGRGRNLKRRIDLNRGQKIGIGKSRMTFPGLTGPAIIGKEILKIHKSTVETEPVIPDFHMKRKSLKIPALQRGYSGRKYPGTSIGAPDPINDYVFEGFDTKVLEYKMVAHMTGNLGRKMRASALVVTGNKNGLAGYAVGKAPVGRAALRKAKNMAAQRLQYIELYNRNTVFHNFAITEGRTKLFVEKMAKGSGLDCHRVVKTICEIIGIQDLKVKVEGSTSNIQNICKGFFRGLMEQETHQKLADRLRLHVVEFRPEYENIPMVVASPTCGTTRDDPIREEAFHFNNMYYTDGRIPLKKVVDPMKFHKESHSRWKSFLILHRDRNQLEAKYQRMIYGLEPSQEEVIHRKKPLK